MIWAGLQNSTALGGADGVTSIFPHQLLMQEQAHKQVNILPGFGESGQQGNQEGKDAKQQQHEHRHHRIAERLVKRSDTPARYTLSSHNFNPTAKVNLWRLFSAFSAPESLFISLLAPHKRSAVWVVLHVPTDREVKWFWLISTNVGQSIDQGSNSLIPTWEGLFSN